MRKTANYLLLGNLLSFCFFVVLTPFVLVYEIISLESLEITFLIFSLINICLLVRYLLLRVRLNKVLVILNFFVLIQFVYIISYIMNLVRSFAVTKVCGIFDSSESCLLPDLYNFIANTTKVLQVILPVLFLYGLVVLIAKRRQRKS